MKTETPENKKHNQHQHHSTCGCVLPGGNIRRRVSITFTEPTLTQQAIAEETDINVIVAKARATGQLPNRDIKGVFQDTTQIPDYQSALNILNEADEAFASLPSNVRAKFKNNPAELLNFISNDQNYDEAVKLGLVQPKPQETPETPPKSNPRANKTNPKNDNQAQNDND